MTLRLITAPTVEPVTVAEVMAWSRIDASNQEPAPGIITAALPGTPVAGNVDNGAHRYRATFVTADGETDGGTISAAVTVADKTVNGKVSLTAIPLGGALVTSRKLYRTAAAGSTYLLLATIADNSTTTYTDNIADASLGAGVPSTNTTSDPMLSMLITAARRVAENMTGRAFITQTWELVLDVFPSKEIEIGMLPIQSITTVKYYDTDGVLQTIAAADYVLEPDTLPGWLLPAYDVDWPDTYDMAQSVIIRFVAGYGSAGSSVPAEIRMWISAQVAAAYGNPTGLMDGKAAALPFIDGLLDAYKIRWL
ncbi:MAG: hypothetical protein NUW22_14205 [Acidobacteria bacterium]|nr:hypothetical protein [Acidobacteriota bacterium]